MQILMGVHSANAPVGINGVKKLELGRTICVKGDLTSGDAIIATSTKNVPRAVFLMFKDGAMQGNAYVEWGLEEHQSPCGTQLKSFH